MSLKNICSIPRHWTLADYSCHTCRDGSHAHLSRAALLPYERRNLVVWLKRAETRRDSSVVWILPYVREREAMEDPVHLPMAALSAVNVGLSFRVGSYLALAVYHHQNWAEAMLLQINMRREDRSIGETQ
jgi:hypothetical protein